MNDPNEHHDLAKEKPDILQQLVDGYNKFSKEPRDMQDQGYHTAVPGDQDACQYMNAHAGYWQPWKE